MSPSSTTPITRLPNEGRMSNRESILWPLLSFGLLTAFALLTIQLNDHLFPWDERFHALVAQNLSRDFSFPMLYADMPLTHFDSSVWYRSEAWLHKPPLFSYQMAFWIFLFGDAVWVMRLNSAFMLLVFAFSLFKIARIHKLDRLAASILSTSFSFSPLLFSLISGRMGMDHNDISFLGHIALSFYFLESFRQKSHVRYALAIGLFSGAAVLTKWLPGLLVFLPFTLFSFKSSKFRTGLLIALSICLLISLSWHAYAYFKFPQEWLRAMAYNQAHFFDTLEEHEQPWYFHLKIWLSYFSIPLVLFSLSLFRRRTDNFGPYIISFLFVLLFFSAAKTKLPAYTIIALVPLFVLSTFVMKTKLKSLRIGVVVLALIAVGISTLQVTNLYKRSLKDSETKVAHFYRELKQDLSDKALLFNLPALQYPQAMYYTGKTAFGLLPSPTELRALEEKGYKIYLLNHAEKPLSDQEYKDFKWINYSP